MNVMKVDFCTLMENDKSLGKDQFEHPAHHKCTRDILVIENDVQCNAKGLRWLSTSSPRAYMSFHAQLL